MRKKIGLPFLTALLFALCALFGGCSLLDGLFGGNSQNTGSEAELVKIADAVPDGDGLFLFADKDTWRFYGSAVQVSEGASWKLYYDEACTDEAKDGVIAGKTGTLSNGENVFYLRVTSGDTKTSNTYRLTVYKSFSAMVRYYDGDQFLKDELVYTGESYKPTYVYERTGYTFIGWRDVEHNTISSDIVWGDINLYAVLTPNTYKATLDVNGGEALQETEFFIAYDADFTLPVTERSGCVFSGWYAGDTQVTDEGGKALSDWNFDGDTVLTARWTPIRYVLTIENENDSAGFVSGAGFIDHGSTATVTATSKGDYTFVGWYDEAGELITMSASYEFEMFSDRTLTAKWELFTLTVRSDFGGAVSPQYVVTFDLNGGSGTTPETQYISEFKPLLYPTHTPTRSGYLFRGWFRDRRPMYSDDPYDFSADIESDIVLYAGWYLLPDGTEVLGADSHNAFNLQLKDSNSRLSVCFVALTDGTYTFSYENWQTELGGGGVSLALYNRSDESAKPIFEDSYNDIKLHTQSIPVKAGNVYCIEIWRARAVLADYYVDLTLSSNGATPKQYGTPVSWKRETPMRAGTTVTLVADANSGFEFLGWYDETGALVSTELVLEYEMPYASKTLTAKWQERA